MNSELAKLTYDLNGDRKTAFNVYNIRKTLTAEGFEYYISFFFERFLGYKTIIPTKVYSSDGCIDIKGIRKNQDGIKEYCIIQCKKHSSTTFSINDVSAFFGRIYHYLEDFPTTKAYFITTSSFTDPAIRYAEEEGIILKNYSNIANIYNYYSLSDFEKDIKEKYPLKYKSIFNKGKDNIEIKSQGKLFSSEEDELLKTLKAIRYSIMKKTHINDPELITNDIILKYLSIKRPHNLDSFKSSLYEGDFNKEDIKHTLSYADEFMKGLLLYA